MNFLVFRKRLAVTSALVLGAALSGVGPGSMASAADPSIDCNGSALQSTAVASVTCQGGGSPSGAASQNNYSGGIDHFNSYVICDPDKLPECIDIPCSTAINAPSGTPGHFIMTQTVYRDGSTTDYTRLCWNNGATGPAFSAAALNRIPPVEITSTWKDHFLVNTPIDFSLAGDRTLRDQLTANGQEVILTSKPKSYRWDFGDGTTDTSPSPSHVWKTNSPDPAHLADHYARVTLTVVWGNEVEQAGQPNQQIDDIVRVAHIIRPIDQVVSVPTELKPNA